MYINTNHAVPEGATVDSTVSAYWVSVQCSASTSGVHVHVHVHVLWDYKHNTLNIQVHLFLPSFSSLIKTCTSKVYELHVPVYCYTQKQPHRPPPHLQLRPRPPARQAPRNRHHRSQTPHSRPAMLPRLPSPSQRLCRHHRRHHRHSNPEPPRQLHRPAVLTRRPPLEPRRHHHRQLLCPTSTTLPTMPVPSLLPPPPRRVTTSLQPLRHMHRQQTAGSSRINNTLSTTASRATTTAHTVCTCSR